MDGASEQKAKEVLEYFPQAVEGISEAADHETLKYSLLGPSLTKAGQDTVDQQKV
jgi:DNA polymerase kappa